MKVSTTNGTGAAGTAGKSRPAGASPGFQLPTTGAVSGPGQMGRAGSIGGLMGVDALLALQEMGGPLERKRRAVNRAGRLLDILDEVKLSLIGGEVTSNDLERLSRAIRDQRENTDDPGLEGVLNEIETRAAVELAKLESASRRT